MWLGAVLLIEALGFRLRIFLWQLPLVICKEAVYGDDLLRLSEAIPFARSKEC